MTSTELVPTSASEVAELVAASDRLTVVGRRRRLPFAEPHGALLVTTLLSQVLEVDRANMVARVEAGVSVADLASALDREHLWFPPLRHAHPQDTIGGVLAAGSLHRSIATGPVREYVLGLRFVDGQGRRIAAGSRAIKNATGYSLTQAIVGSWGTLGVVVEATLRLLPVSRDRVVHHFAFSNVADAARAATALAEVAGIAAAELDRRRSQIHLAVEAVATLADAVAAVCDRFGGVRVEGDDGGTDIAVAEKTPIEVALPASRVPDFVQALDADFALEGSPATGYLAVYPTAGGDFGSQARHVYDLALAHGGRPVGHLAWSDLGAPALRQQLGEAGLHALRALKRAFDPRGVFPELPVVRG